MIRKVKKKKVEIYQTSVINRVKLTSERIFLKITFVSIIF